MAVRAQLVARWLAPHVIGSRLHAQILCKAGHHVSVASDPIDGSGRNRCVLTGLACLNNLMDYNSNFALVQHVLSMDTTFPEGTLRWRAITSPTVHHAAYWLIIAIEGLAGVLCLAGAYKMLLARKAGTDIFNQSKNLALWGLGIALALYLIGFMVIGAEWFAMCSRRGGMGGNPHFESSCA